MKIFLFPLFACVFFSLYSCSAIAFGQEYEPGTSVTVSAQTVSQYIGQNGDIIDSGPVQHIELTFNGRSLFASICGSTGFHTRREHDKELSIGVGFRKNLHGILTTGETHYHLLHTGSAVSSGITFSRKYHIGEPTTTVPFVKLECFAPILSHPTPGILATIGCASRVKLPRNFFFASRIAITKDSGALNFKPGLWLAGTTTLGRSFTHNRSEYALLMFFSIPIARHEPHTEERHPRIAVGVQFSYHHSQ